MQYKSTEIKETDKEEKKSEVELIPNLTPTQDGLHVFRTQCLQHQATKYYLAPYLSYHLRHNDFQCNQEKHSAVSHQLWSN